MAIELREVFAKVHQWSSYQDSSGLPVASHLVVTEDNGCTLIDPCGAPTRHDIEAVVRIGRPDVIVLTTANHERDVSTWRQKLGVPVMVHADAAARLRMRAFEHIKDNAALPGRLRAIHAPGATPGEIAIYVPWNGGAFIIGDGLQNTLETHGLGLLAPEKCHDPIYLRASIEKLHRWPFEALLFSHGEPVIKGARDRLGWVLETAPLPRPKNLPLPLPKIDARKLKLAAKEEAAEKEKAAKKKAAEKEKAAKKKAAVREKAAKKKAAVKEKAAKKKAAMKKKAAKKKTAMKKKAAVKKKTTKKKTAVKKKTTKKKTAVKKKATKKKTAVKKKATKKKTAVKKKTGKRRRR